MHYLDELWRSVKWWIVLATLLLGGVLCLLYALGCIPLIEVNYYYESIRSVP